MSLRGMPGLAALLAPLLLPALLRAQEEAPKNEPDPSVLLSTALRQLHGHDSLVAKVEVKQEVKELQAPAAGGAFGGAVVVESHVAGMGKPFEGTVEAWRDRDGKVVVLSQQALPGFGLYLDGDRFLKEVTYEEETYAVDQIKAELVPLLDAPRFTRHLLDAKLKGEKDPLTGLWVFKGKLSRKVVKPTRGAFGMMQKRVLRTEAEVAVTDKGELRRVALKVVHNDPVREMMRKQVQGAGGVPAPPPGTDDADDDNEHDVETGSTTYRLTLQSAPSERAQAFRKRMEKLVGDE